MGALEFQGGAGAIEGSIDQKIGVVAIKMRAWAPDLDTAINGSTLTLGVNIPEVLPRNFALRQDGQGYDVTMSFEGHQTPTSAEGEDYSLEGTTSEDPIESHPDYQSLLEVYSGEEDESTGKAKWPKTLGDDGGRNAMHGVESYLVPGCTWTRKSVSATFPVALLRALGKIDSPPGSPPRLTGNRNWLKIRVRATLRGNCWQIEESWMLSAEDGWIAEVYRQT